MRSLSSQLWFSLSDGDGRWPRHPDMEPFYV